MGCTNFWKLWSNPLLQDCSQLYLVNFSLHSYSIRMAHSHTVQSTLPLQYTVGLLVQLLSMEVREKTWNALREERLEPVYPWNRGVLGLQGLLPLHGLWAPPVVLTAFSPLTLSRSSTVKLQNLLLNYLLAPVKLPIHATSNRNVLRGFWQLWGLLLFSHLLLPFIHISEQCLHLQGAVATTSDHCLQEPCLILWPSHSIHFFLCIFHSCHLLRDP